MNFSELYFSWCLLKRQKLLLRVCMLFKCNWLFTTSFVSFWFFGWSACIIFLLCICSLWEQWNIIFKMFFLIVLRNKLQVFLIEKITLNIVFWRFPCYWQVGKNSNDVREKPHFFPNFSLIVRVHFYGITFSQFTLFCPILLFKLVKRESASRSACPILCDPMDCNPQGSSVHGNLQARILEWVAVPFSKGSSWPRAQTGISCIAGGFFTIWVTIQVIYDLKLHKTT